MNRKVFGSFLAIFLVLCMMFPTMVLAQDYRFTAQEGEATCTKEEVTFKDSNITAANLNKISKDLFDETNNNIMSVKYKGDTYELLMLDNSGGEGVITVNITAMKACGKKQVNQKMKAFTDAISQCGGNDDTVQQIMNDIQDCDPAVSTIMLPLIFDSTKADMYTAYKITGPFLDIMSVIMGVGAVGVIIILLFSTVMDLVYIGLPVWRNTQAEKNGNSGKRPFGVSYEADSVVKEVEGQAGGGSAGEYKNAYLIYLKRRALTYIILAICIMYLIAGGLSGIISFILQLVSGITG